MANNMVSPHSYARSYAHSCALLRKLGQVGVACVAVMLSSHALSAQMTAAETVANAAQKRATVTLNVSAQPLIQVLKAIAEQAGLEPFYNAEIETVPARVTMNVQQVPAQVAFEKALQGTGWVATVNTRDVVFEKPQMSTKVAQGVVTGVVRSAKTKQPVVGATIVVGDGKQDIVSGEQGTFRMSLDAGEHRIAVRAVGFVRQVKSVTVHDGETVTVEFLMEPSASVLNEVVVTGTVIATKRKAIPNPITVITAEDIEKRGITRVDQLLRGEVPGVFVVDLGSESYSDDGLGAMVTSQVYSRGSSDIGPSGTPTPLKTYIDGVELLDPSYLGTIDPASIERIEIITGPQAATVYGSGAMGGVMQVFTKKGSATRTEVVANLRYGVLQNNLSSGLAPSHKHDVRLSGGSGPGLTYAGTLSLNSTGQWQPFLWNRIVGTTLGALHVRGPITVNASIMATFGRNGTYSTASPNAQGPVTTLKLRSGEYVVGQVVAPSQIEGVSSNQNLSLTVDYRQNATTQHHLTIGRSQNQFDLVPESPRFGTPHGVDTLFRIQESNGQRATFGYNVSNVTSFGRFFSNTISLGVTGSSGGQTVISGYSGAASSSVLVTNPVPAVSRPIAGSSWGAFGRWQLGIFDQLYLTLGLRAERNPNYGRAHKVDWTPNNGITYTLEYGDLTMKLLGSYGRATRAPTPDARLEVHSRAGQIYPAEYVSRLANPNLTPEYSRGPQGGIELYYGNLGSLAITHYNQVVSDLIFNVSGVDSVLHLLVATGEDYFVKQSQYNNVGEVRSFGWEGVATVNMWRLNLKGTWSWTDSRTIASRYFSWVGTFKGIPSHTAAIVASYSSGGANITLTTNFIGRKSVGYTFGPFAGDLYYAQSRGRILMYNDLGRRFGVDHSVPGYSKSNLTASQHINSSLSFILNITNVTNSYESDGRYDYPTLGRQTLFGLSIRPRLFR